MYSYVPVLKSIALKKVKAQSAGSIYYRGSFNLRTGKMVPALTDVQQATRLLIFPLKKIHICSEPGAGHPQEVFHMHHLI